jgi:hypothetical protein
MAQAPAVKGARGSLPKRSPSDTAINADDCAWLGLLEAGPAASLALHLLVTLLEKALAFAVLAFRFRLACVFLHMFFQMQQRERQPLSG